MRRTVLALLLVAAACGGGAEPDAGDAAVASTTVASTATSTTGADVDAGTTDPDDAGPTDAAPDAPSGAPGAVEGGATGAASEAGQPDGPEPIAPGTYRYRQRGEVSAGPQSFAYPAEGTSVVDPPTAEPTQRVRRYIDPEREPAETWLRFSPEGVLLYETTISQPGMTVTCVFRPAVAIPAWPPTVGATSEGTGDCGTFTTHLSTRITGRDPVTLDGVSYDAYLITSTVTTTGDIESTTTQVDHYVAELRLSARSESHTSGTYRGFAFESTLVAELLSAVPS
ncbi:MAG TPA: hypothetical protein VM262_18830 [Acidimicrobiales bacterium]|nr:hypothetical protein [Acidimicrobiales bacterium]